MDTMTFTFVLILLAVGILLVAQVSPYYSRKDYSHHESPEEEWEATAHHEELKEMHRMRRQRDRVWFRMDGLHAEFVKRTSVEEQALKQRRTQPPSQAGDSQAGADNWNDITLTYIKEQYESFLKKD
ncbi:MAG TPA: hypothetical protein VF553_01580 [Pyrinomonadaceae bacterium]|jgi:hypothetical protein